MRKIILECEYNNKKWHNKSAVYFHGWLMQHLDNEYVSALHESEMNAYTIHARRKQSTIEFVISLLNEEAIDQISPILLNPDTKSISFHSTNETYLIQKRNIEDFTQSDLSRMFYDDKKIRHFEIEFITPTSFKRNGEYTLFPDLRLIYQSLIQKYTFIFEESKEVDKELLQSLVERTKIVSYQLRSSYHPIHRTHIPGFIGKIKIKSSANQTLSNYLHMLLMFGEFAGVGIKTSMGMGAIKITVI